MSWGAVAVGVGSLVGGYMASEGQKDAASSAANSAKYGADKSSAVQQYMFDKSLQYLDPYHMAGLGGLQALSNPDYFGSGQAPQAVLSGGQTPYAGSPTGQIQTQGMPSQTTYNNPEGFKTPDQPWTTASNDNFEGMSRYNPDGTRNPAWTGLTGDRYKTLGISLDGTQSSANNQFWDSPNKSFNYTPQQLQGEQYRNQLAGLNPNNLPSTPNLPQLNNLPSVPGKSALPNLPGMEQLPNAPNAAKLPGIPNAPGLPEFSYKFDANDPGYQFRAQQQQKAIDQAAAARGNYNSRAAINAQSEGSMALTADEIDRQFGRQKDIFGMGMDKAGMQFGMDKDVYGMGHQNAMSQFGMDSDIFGMNQSNALSRFGMGSDLFGMGMNRSAADFGMGSDIYNMGFQNATTQYGADTQRAKDMYGMDYQKSTDLYNRDYGKLTDLYNMSQGLDATRYNQMLDLTKIGQGAAGQAGNAALATGQGLSSTYGNLAAAQMQSQYAKGAANSDFWSGLGALPMNYMIMQNMMQ